MSVQTAVKTGLTGIWVHGKSVRVDFMHKGTRHRHTLGIEPTEVNLHHAARLRTAALYALKTGNYNALDFFPDSRPADINSQQSKRLSQPWMWQWKRASKPQPGNRVGTGAIP